MANGGLGFWRLNDQNEAFIIELACSSRPNRISAVESLGVVWQDVRKNITWNFGHGHDVDFWYDVWIKDLGPLFQYVSTCMWVMARGTLVSSMIDVHGVWNWGYLGSLLPQDVLLHIVPIKEPIPYLGKASIGWKGTSDSCFSVKSTYNFRIGP
ncbi:hypothetical protein V6N13_116242 [Hibiscus sabdariffa]